MRLESDTISPLAQDLIVRCRAEIEAGWVQLKAALDLLDRNRPLYERWQRALRNNEMATMINLPVAPDTAPFTLVVDMPRGRRARPSRRRARFALAPAGLRN